MSRHPRNPFILLVVAGLLALLVLPAPGCRGKGPAGSAGARGRTPGAAGPAAPSVLIIGLDGADWELIDRLAAQGKIPNLARLRREGAWGPLTSEEPLISPIVWTTIATGRSPLDHGIFGFLTRRNGVAEPVRSDERQVRAFWNIASDYDVPVGVIGWYATWPPEPVKGFLVSDRAGVHQISGKGERPTTGLAYPADAEREVEAVRQQVSRVVDESAARSYFAHGADLSLLPKDKMPTFLGLLRTTEMERLLFWPLCKEYRPRVAAVYFEGTDAVGHLFIDYAPPAAPNVDPRLTAMFGGALDAYYARIDEIIGEMTEPLSPRDSTVIIVSDHGFRTGADRPQIPTIVDGNNQAPEWHNLDGIVMMWGRGVKAGARIENSRVYDVLPTILRLAGLPLAKNLPGRPIESALTSEVLSRPAESIADFEAKGPRVKGSLAAPASAEENEEQIERLRALGYIGGATAPEKEQSAAAKSEDGQLNNPFTLFYRLILLLGAGRDEEALAAGRESVQRFPGSMLSWYGEALALKKLSRFEEAYSPLQHAVSMAQNNATVLTHLGEVELKTGRVQDAERDFARAASLDPSMWQPAYMLVSQFYVSRGETERAAAILEALLSRPLQARERAISLSEMGIINESRGRPADAERNYREALAAAPNYSDNIGRLARLLFSQKRMPEALPLIEQFIAKEPQEFRGYTLYGFALAEVGRKREARAALEESLSLQPNQAPARRLLSQLGS